MARKPDSFGQLNLSANSSTIKIPAEPLVVDDEAMDDDGNEALEDLEVEMSRHRARTLFHQPRADNDTMQVRRFNSTRSLYDTDLVYKEIHGRTYVGDYYMPIDSDEQTRLQILHGVFLRLLDNKLTTVPLENPQKILDIGTGTGDWAVAMGEEFPDADIIGTDIARIQPSAVPHNVFFEIDDAEEEGGSTWPEHEFDLVHIRSLSGAFEDWNKIYSEAFRILKPGLGWIEVIDFDDHGAFNQSGSFRSYFPPDSEVIELLDSVEEAAKNSKRPRGVKHLEEKILSEAGFVDISVIEKQIPMGVWPEDKEDQKVGKHFLVCQLAGIESVVLRLLAEQGWEIEELRRKVKNTIDAVKAVALDSEKGKGLGFKVRILTGRKPEHSDSRGYDWRSGVGSSTRTLTTVQGS